MKIVDPNRNRQHPESQNTQNISNTLYTPTDTTAKTIPNKSPVKIILIGVIVFIAVIASMLFVASTQTCVFGHNMQPATCSKAAYCSKCQIQAGDKKEHEWQKTNITQEPTCTENGNGYHECSECGEQEYVELPRLGHLYGEVMTIQQATCAEKGESQQTCSRCSFVQTKEIDKIAHCYVETGETNYKYEPEKKCKMCDSSYGRESGLPEGSYIVGKDIKPGEYKISPSVLNDSAYYDVYPDISKSKILSNDFFKICSYVILEDGQLIELERGVIHPISDALPSKVASTQGFYKVGFDLPAGSYKATATDGGGYYDIKNSCSVESRTIQNDFFRNTSYFTVRDGQYIELSDCTIEQLD